MRKYVSLILLAAFFISPARAQTHPNIVFVLTDDLSWNLVQFMPNVQQMQREGVTFRNFFVTDSLCCPSRSSIFTGRLPHNTGIFTNGGPLGGYRTFERNGLPAASLAVQLQASGIRTAMLGKYLNGYEPRRDPPDPGWDFWSVAGNGYREFRYYLNTNGTTRWYGSAPKHYLTDVIAHQAAKFIRDMGSQQFFIEVATFAPHGPYVPAPRHANKLRDVRLPRGPAFNTPAEGDPLHWLQVRPPLTAAYQERLDHDFRLRAQSVIAVDEMIGLLRRSVEAAGQAANTYFVFSSDNGFHMGEHRMNQGKLTAYDEDIRVPLIIVGPGVPPGREVTEVTENIDLAATFAELMGTSMTDVDGRSLARLVHGQSEPGWRTMALVEHRGPVHGPDDPDMPLAKAVNPPSYEALRARDWQYVEYADGGREYHDLLTDPHEMRNTYSSLPMARQAELRGLLAAAVACRGAAPCWAAQGGQPAPP